jgi:hypothetical protein
VKRDCQVDRVAAAGLRPWILAMVVAVSVGLAAAGDPADELLPLGEFWGGEPEPPFGFALVLAGGGYDVFAHFGIVDATIDAGRPPEVLVAPCGTSIVAAVLNAIPDRDERLAFVFSPTFHQLMRTPEQRKITPGLASMAFSIWRRSFGFTDKVPRLYDFPVVSFPDDFEADFINSDFGAEEMRLLIVATRTEIGPEDKGQTRAGRKLFQEIVFTDPDTARYLADFEAPVGHYFPDSSYMIDADVRVGATLFDAVRASISDMYFVEPYLYQGERYVTGGFDLHVELARGMAREVAVTWIAGYDPILSDAAVESVLGYRLNQRLRLSTAGYADWWIDISDKKDWGEMKFRILQGVPEDYETFLDLARQQYEMGYCRAREGLTQAERNEKRHIRNVGSRNTFKSVRKAIATALDERGAAGIPDCDVGNEADRRIEWDASRALTEGQRRGDPVSD